VWFPALDGLRAIAALLVVVFHVSQASGVNSPDALVGPVTSRFGNYGVAIFFVLSGFLMWRPFVRAHLEGRPPTTSLADYTKRRLLRIVPAYWLALFFLLVVVRGPGSTSLGDAVRYATFTQIYKQGDVLSGLSVAWTLCIEVSFYVLVPILAALLVALVPRTRPLKERLVAHAALPLVLALVSMAFRWWALRDFTKGFFWLPSYLDWFAAGMILAVAHSYDGVARRQPALVRTLASMPWLCWVVGIAFFWLTTTLPMGLPSRNQYMLRFACFAVSGLLLLLPLVLGDQSRGVLRATLSGQPLHWLGEISYGIYLWHTVWIEVLRGYVRDGSYPSGFWPLLAGTLVLTIIVAHLSYRFLERPVLALAHRRPRAPAPATPGLAP